MAKLKDKQISYRFVVLMILLTLVFLTRIFLLEIDIPNWDISNYYPIDEMEYVIKAYDWASNFDYQSLNIPPELNKHLSDTGHLFINSVTYASFKVFGNNYFGLRMPSFLFAMGAIIFTLLIMKKIKSAAFQGSYKDLPCPVNIRDTSEKALSLAMILVMTYFVFDFTFMMSSMFAEPAISRSFYMLFVVFMFLSLERYPRLCYFMQGMLITISIILVYTASIFMFVPVGIILLLMLIKREKTVWILMGSFIVGCTIGFLVGILLFYFTSNGLSFFDSVQLLSGIFSSRITTSIRQVIINCVNISFGNIFRFNPILFYIMINSILINLYFLIRNKNKNTNYILFLLIGFMFQLIAMNEYPVIRKIVIILPVILINIYISAQHIIVNKNNLNLSERSKSLFIGFQIFLLSIFILLYSMWSDNIYNIISMQQDKLNLFITVLTLLPLTVALSCFIFIIIKRKKTIIKKLKINIIIGFILLSLLPNVIMQLKYIYLSNDYSEKAIMIEIGDIVGNDYVVGGFAHHFSLYNETIPIMSAYDYYLGNNFTSQKYALLLENNSVKYYLAHELEREDILFKPIYYYIDQSKYKFEKIKSFPYREYADPHDRQLALYKIIRTSSVG